MQLLRGRAREGKVEGLTAKHEAARHPPWEPDPPPDFLAANLRAIAGFELRVTRIEAKFKLSQNGDESDREGALAGLEAEGDPESLALAAFARSYFR
ncbi:MAG: FMN-binding negative transcriptional regulator [Gemmatimonadaceae bacterium]